MIENDEQFQEAFKEYLKDYKFEKGECHLCDGFPCRDCLLKPINDETGKVCSEVPFQRIKEYEKKIRLLKQQISILENWKRNKDMNKKLQDFCKTFRSSNNDLSELTCYGINCNTCPFGGIGNLKEWARRAKAKSEVKRDD